MKKEYWFDKEVTEKGVKYKVKVLKENIWIEVQEDVYFELLHSYDNAEYHQKKWNQNTYSLELEYENGTTLEGVMSSLTSLLPEEYVYKKEFWKNMHDFVLESCTETEYGIYRNVILGGLTECEYFNMTGIPRTTINYQKRKILKRIKKDFKKF